MVKSKSKSAVKNTKKDASIIHAMSHRPEFRNRIDEMIAEAAYYKAEKRNFDDGFEMEDWLEAEREINENPMEDDD